MKNCSNESSSNDKLPADRNCLENIGLEHWHEHIKYHRNSMEVRRSIQIRVFTGCVVLLLLLGKTGYDILIGPGGNEKIRLLLQVSVFLVPIFLFFFLWQIERVNKNARENYTYLSNRINAHFLKKAPQYNQFPNEKWFTTFVRSWAMTWPIIATVVLAICIFVGFKLAPLRVKDASNNNSKTAINTTSGKTLKPTISLKDKKQDELKITNNSSNRANSADAKKRAAD